jgi:hypothetical protein
MLHYRTQLPFVHPGFDTVADGEPKWGGCTWAHDTSGITVVVEVRILLHPTVLIVGWVMATCLVRYIFFFVRSMPSDRICLVVAVARTVLVYRSAHSVCVG